MYMRITQAFTLYFTLGLQNGNCIKLFNHVEKSLPIATVYGVKQICEEIVKVKAV